MPTKHADLKKLRKCRQCQRYGHWRSDHKPDGCLTADALATETTSPPSSDRHRPISISCCKLPKKTLTFNMFNTCSKTTVDDTFLGSFINDGAPYSGLGYDAFSPLQPIISPNWSGDLLAVPENFSDSLWQYGSGQHSSEPQSALGSVFLNICSHSSNTVSIFHLIGSFSMCCGTNGN